MGWHFVNTGLSNGFYNAYVTYTLYYTMKTKDNFAENTSTI